MARDTDTCCVKAANRFILAKQHLSENSKIDDIVQVTRDLGGLHATSAITPYLSLLARMPSFCKEDLQKELYVKKSLAKVTYVRKTIFILPADRLPMALAAFRRNTEILTDQHLEFLQISQKTYSSTAKDILDILEKKELTLKELKTEMGTVPNLMYIVRMMCFQGLLIRCAPRSGWKSNLHTYAPLGKHYPDVEKSIPGEKDAQRSVIKEYITHYGPVTETDICWWTGFPKGLVRECVEEIRNELSTLRISDLDGLFFILSTQNNTIQDISTQNSGALSVLPCLDPYLMGYKDRGRYIDEQHYSFIFDRSGNATSTIIKEGKVIGVWDYNEPVFNYFLFSGIDGKTLDHLRIQAENIGRFFSDKNTRIKKCSAMKPLTKRTAAGVFSPLKES